MNTTQNTLDNDAYLDNRENEPKSRHDRNSLAEKRTLISWLRTGLSFVGFGIASQPLAAFFNLKVAAFAGLGFLAVGIILMLVGFA